MRISLRHPCRDMRIQLQGPQEQRQRRRRSGAGHIVGFQAKVVLDVHGRYLKLVGDGVSLEHDFGLKADDVTSYKGLKSNDNGDAGLVLAIQPAAGKAQDVMDTLKTYQQDQVAFYGNYAEFAQAQSNVENAIIDGGDDLVVMVIASNDCSSDLTSAVKDVLGK